MVPERRSSLADAIAPGPGSATHDGAADASLRAPRTRVAPADVPKRLVVGAATIATYELHPRRDRSSGVAAGRLRLLMPRGGTLQIPARPGDIEVGDGQGLLVNGAASLRMSSSGAGKVIAVGMPVEALPGLAMPRGSTMLIEDAALLRPIGAFVQTLFDGEPLDVLAREYVERLLREMVMVAVRRSSGESGVAPSLHQRALRAIRRHHADARLTPAEIASMSNVSLRQLERAFQREGRTVRREIRRVRVVAAAALLQDARRASDTVDVIAVQVGLSNGSSLARAMAAEGLPSPSALRATARTRPSHT